MKSNAWQERRSESAKASDRIMAIEEAERAVIEAAEAWAKTLHIKRPIDKENELLAAVAHLRSVRESK